MLNLLIHGQDLSKGKVSNNKTLLGGHRIGVKVFEDAKHQGSHRPFYPHNGHGPYKDIPVIPLFLNDKQTEFSQQPPSTPHMFVTLTTYRPNYLISQSWIPTKLDVKLVDKTGNLLKQQMWSTVLKHSYKEDKCSEWWDLGPTKKFNKLIGNDGNLQCSLVTASPEMNQTSDALVSYDSRDLEFIPEMSMFPKETSFKQEWIVKNAKNLLFPLSSLGLEYQVIDGKHQLLWKKMYNSVYKMKGTIKLSIKCDDFKHNKLIANDKTILLDINGAGIIRLQELDNINYEKVMVVSIDFSGVTMYCNKLYPYNNTFHLFTHKCTSPQIKNVVIQPPLHKNAAIKVCNGYTFLIEIHAKFVETFKFNDKCNPKLLSVINFNINNETKTIAVFVSNTGDSRGLRIDVACLFNVPEVLSVKLVLYPHRLLSKHNVKLNNQSDQPEFYCFFDMDDVFDTRFNDKLVIQGDISCGFGMDHKMKPKKFIPINNDLGTFANLIEGLDMSGNEVTYQIYIE